MKSFDILHFSYRHWNSYHEEGCYRVNLVFRVFDIQEYSYTKQRFMNECKEWREAEIVTDLELEEKYSSGLEMINSDTGKCLLEDWDEEKKEYKEYVDKKKLIPIGFINTNNIEREDVYVKGYQENWNSMFQHIEKFDVFRFYEYFEINPATKGIIEYIEELKEMKESDEYHAEQFFRVIKSLELWWD